MVHILQASSLFQNHGYLVDYYSYRYIQIIKDIVNISEPISGENNLREKKKKKDEQINYRLVLPSCVII